MNVAYLDTSFLLSILFGEPGARKLRSQLSAYDLVYSADLLVAETLAAATREKVGLDAVEAALKSISLLFPDRTLAPEIGEVLAHGYLGVRISGTWRVPYSWRERIDRRLPFSRATTPSARWRIESAF